MYPIFKPTIYFDESEMCKSWVDDDTLRTIAKVEGYKFKDMLLFPKELDDTG
jgi:hypothetical protein